MGLRPCWLSFRNFNAIAGFKVQLGQTWSRHSLQNRHYIVMGLRQYWFSLESISNLAGLEFNLDSTCFKNGPKMVPKNIHSKDIGLTPCWLRVEHFSALAHLEVMLGQTWSQHGPDMAPEKKLHRHGPYTMLTQSWEFQCWSGCKTEPNMVMTWSPNIDTP